MDLGMNKYTITHKPKMLGINLNMPTHINLKCPQKPTSNYTTMIIEAKIYQYYIKMKQTVS